MSRRQFARQSIRIPQHTRIAHLRSSDLCWCGAVASRRLSRKTEGAHQRRAFSHPHFREGAECTCCSVPWCTPGSTLASSFVVAKGQQAAHAIRDSEVNLVPFQGCCSMAIVNVLVLPEAASPTTLVAIPGRDAGTKVTDPSNPEMAVEVCEASSCAAAQRP